MAVTAAPAGKEPRRVALKQIISGCQWQVSKQNLAPSTENEPVPGSFDWHDNLIRAHHIQAAARSRLDGARIIPQFLDFSSQHSIAAA